MVCHSCVRWARLVTWEGWTDKLSASCGGEEHCAEEPPWPRGGKDTVPFHSQRHPHMEPETLGHLCWETGLWAAHTQHNPTPSPAVQKLLLLLK